MSKNNEQICRKSNSRPVFKRHTSKKDTEPLLTVMENSTPSPGVRTAGLAPRSSEGSEGREHFSR